MINFSVGQISRGDLISQIANFAFCDDSISRIDTV